MEFGNDQICLLIKIIIINLFFTLNFKIGRSDTRFKINEDNNGGEYYTSMLGIQKLAKEEQTFLKELIQFRLKLKNRLNLIDGYLNDYTNSVTSLNGSFKTVGKYPLFDEAINLNYLAESISANPLNAFKLLRRFSKELNAISSDVIQNDFEADFKKFILSFKANVVFPGKADVNGAADGILRLQEVYQLSTHELAKGLVGTKQTNCKLTAYDLQQISLRAIAQRKLATAAEWAYQAYQRIQKGDTSIKKETIRNFLETIRLHHNEKFIKFRKSFPNLFSNLINSTFQNILEMYIAYPVPKHPLGELSDPDIDDDNYNALCRGEKLLSPEKAKDLYCYYSSGSSAFNILAPFKFELHHIDPPLYQIYDLLSDKLINNLKNIARPTLARAQVAPESGDLNDGPTLSDYRTSFVTWIYDENGKDNPSKKISKITEGFTGLSCSPLTSSEFLQISCYGSIGGHYGPHLDAFIDLEVAENVPFSEWHPDLQERGDRVATVMFYLSDVELGGGTAFSRLGVVSEVVKGSAMMWFNLKYNGNIENLMTHGGCPVLYGEKWVANKWIRLYDQFQNRQCKRNKFQ